MTDEAKKFRDEQSKQRAVQIQIKQKETPTLSVFENANNSYKKGFDAGYEYREKEVQALKQRIEKLKSLLLLTDPCISNIVVNETAVTQWIEYIKCFPEDDEAAK